MKQQESGVVVEEAEAAAVVVGGVQMVEDTPSAGEEKAEAARILKHATLVEGASWYLVSGRWWRRFCEYTGLEEGVDQALTARRSRPGPVDNSDLLTPSTESGDDGGDDQSQQVRSLRAPWRRGACPFLSLWRVSPTSMCRPALSSVIEVLSTYLRLRRLDLQLRVGLSADERELVPKELWECLLRWWATRLLR